MHIFICLEQRFGGTLWHTPYRLTKKFGSFALSRGLVTSLVREGVFTASYLGVMPVVKEKIRAKEVISNEYAIHLFSGMIAGFLGAFTTHPVDTVKTCMQGDIERAQYTNIINTFKKVYAQGGMKRLYYGFGWRYSSICLAVTVLDKSKELLAPLLFPKYF
ncbi:hypothetical protein RFI_21914 [Reticulomyxa filosa]|uniref:Mitochondrial carrier protein n=1 Tax=Reticulomyxa filosa TaxID=46433 RepID=X6MP73_RETFI|nr:hypothetical protein RFI_21914 [Reticulomyxa filosa]|eukprot:ETO15451.1 hypothetical protein RFI_21914 [Reticulomyxa filosa]